MLRPTEAQLLRAQHAGQVFTVANCSPALIFSKASRACSAVCVLSLLCACCCWPQSEAHRTLLCFSHKMWLTLTCVAGFSFLSAGASVLDLPGLLFSLPINSQMFLCLPYIHHLPPARPGPCLGEKQLSISRESERPLPHQKCPANCELLSDQSRNAICNRCFAF